MQGLLLHAIVHSAGVQDRDGGIWLLATLFGQFPFLAKLFADSAYAGSIFHTALGKVLPNLKTEIVRRSDRAKGFVPLPKRKSVLGVNTPEHHVMPRGVRSPAALPRICASASSLGGGRTVHHNRFAETTRCRRHPIGGLRPRTPMCTNSVGESLRGSTFGAIPRTNEITTPLLTE